jgi:hypothetical protein
LTDQFIHGNDVLSLFEGAAMSIAAISDFRTAQGRFSPGQSGNPAGRPKGARNRSTVLAEALLDEHAEPVTRKVIECAEAGDGAMLRLLFTRIVRSGRDRLVTLDVPEGKELDAEEVFRVTARALFDGEISPDEALRIGRFITLSARLRAMKLRPGKAAARPAPEKDLDSPPEGTTPAKEGAAVEAGAEGSAEACRPLPDEYFSREPSEGPRADGMGSRFRGNDEEGAPPASDQYFSRERSATRQDEVAATPESALYFSRRRDGAGVVQPAS